MFAKLFFYPSNLIPVNSKTNRLAYEKAVDNSFEVSTCIFARGLNLSEIEKFFITLEIVSNPSMDIWYDQNENKMTENNQIINPLKRELILSNWISNLNQSFPQRLCWHLILLLSMNLKFSWENWWFWQISGLNFKTWIKTIYVFWHVHVYML